MRIQSSAPRRLALQATGLFCLSAIMTAGLSRPAEAGDGGRSSGTVYTLSNSADGNDLVVFEHTRQGFLVLAGTVPTGGLGTGGGLDNQGGAGAQP